MYAAQLGNCEQMKVIIGRHKDCIHVKTGSEKGWTALHFAVFHGVFKAVYLLISEGADASTQSTDGTTPMDIALSKLDGKNLRTRVDAERYRRAHMTLAVLIRALYSSAETTAIPIMKRVDEKNVGIDAQDGHGNTLLHDMARTSRMDMCKVLLKYGADWRIINDHHPSPVDVAQCATPKAVFKYSKRKSTT